MFVATGGGTPTGFVTAPAPRDTTGAGSVQPAARLLWRRLGNLREVFPYTDNGLEAWPVAQVLERGYEGLLTKDERSPCAEGAR